MKSLSRRQFHALTLSAAAMAALGPVPSVLARRRADEDGTLFDWQELPGGAWVAMGQGGNTLLVRSAGQAVLIDCKNPGLGATLRREAESFGTPVRLVVNTHHHGDHSGGNPAFTADLPLVAHAKAKPRIIAQSEEMLGRARRVLQGLEGGEKPAPKRVIDEVKSFIDSIAGVPGDAFAPTRVVEERMEADKFGDLEVQYHHIGPGHTDNDMVVFFPSLNLVHMGDLLFHRRYPVIDLAAGATTIGWQESVREIIKLCDAKTTVIPGHGEITDVNGLATQVEFFNKIREVVRHAKDVEGMTKEEVMNLTPGAFEGYEFQQMRPRTLGAVFEELEKK
ncbi:MAG: MBL fold metallo-hydrolase [Phycisphaerae bacterium]|nr:MBL fold metallo-hydrolase [Phycisphaerae bacterium]